MIAGLAYLDAALLLIVVISGLVAMYRGLTREVLSILSWIIAAGAVAYFIKYHRGVAEELAKQFANPPQTSHVYIAQVVIGAPIFVVVLIIVHLITSRISDTVLDSRVGAIDRILGFGFGVVRGFVLVVIPYMFTVSFICKDSASRASTQGCKPGELPVWIENAHSLPIISQTSGTLFSILSRYAPSAPIGEQQQGYFLQNHHKWIARPLGQEAPPVLYPSGPVESKS
ncbi:MAG: CvpA family protein [Hyphomicrobiaceae bacterium]|nr:MAG: CvpA family protein [Hyphomicrobiaceae bacterium]